MASRNLELILSIKDQTQKSLKSFASQLGNVENRFKKSSEASNSFAIGLGAVGVAIGGVATMGLKFAGDMETARMGLVTLLGSAEEADKTLTRLKEEAARTPFELKGLTNATQLLSAVTKDGSKSIDILLDIGESLAAMGKGQEELDRIIVNLQQVGAVGKASMLDIKQFAFAGIPIFEMLQEQTGLAGEALNEFISDGGVTFDLLTEMFSQATNEGGRFFGAFTNQAGTLNQVWSNLKDTIGIALGTFVEQTGLLNAMKTAITGVTNAIPPMINLVQKTIKFFQEHKSAIYIVSGAILGALVPSLYAAMAAFTALAVSLAPFIIGGAIIGGLVAGLLWIVKNWELIKQKAIEIWDSIIVYLSTAWQSIVDTAQMIWQTLKDYLVSFWVGLQTTVRSGITNIITFVKSTNKLMVDAWGYVWDGVKTRTIESFNSIKDTIKNAINWIIQKINWFVRKANEIAAKGNVIPGVEVPTIPEIPMLAKGGIVTKPTLAMVGEAGAEAVIPLNKAGNIGGNITVNINESIISDEDGASKIGQIAAEEIAKQIKLNQSFSF